MTCLVQWQWCYWNQWEKSCENSFNIFSSIIDCEFVISARCLASSTREIISNGPLVGNAIRILTRHCSECLPRVHLIGMPFRTGSIHKGWNYFLEALGVPRCDPKVFGLHSLRAGGITSVVKNDDSKVVSESRGPFLESPETFSGPESHS